MYPYPYRLVIKSTFVFFPQSILLILYSFPVPSVICILWSALVSISSFSYAFSLESGTNHTRHTYYLIMSTYAMKAILRNDQNHYHAMFYFCFFSIFNLGFERAAVSYDGNSPAGQDNLSFLFLGIAKKGASLSDYRPGD